MASSTREPLLRTLRAELREFFLLEGPDAGRTQLSESQLGAMTLYREAASWRLAAARHLCASGHERASLLFYREATLFLVWAFLSTKSSEPHAPDPAATGSAIERFDAALEADGLRAPDALGRAEKHLAAGDPMDVDRLTPLEVGRTSADLDEAAEWLAKLVESPRSPGQRTATRTLRIAVAAGLLASLLVVLGRWAFSPTNVALHAHVTASSHAYGTTPQGAVDGKRYEPLGFHSDEEDSPWLSIDLDRPHVIRRVKAFGRADCCFDQSIPLVLEVSDDGASYRKIAERTEEFNQWDPWVIEGGRSLVARFVRFRTTRNSVLVLSEVEVYGKPVNPR